MSYVSKDVAMGMVSSSKNSLTIPPIAPIAPPTVVPTIGNARVPTPAPTAPPLNAAFIYPLFSPLSFAKYSLKMFLTMSETFILTKDLETFFCMLLIA